MRLALRIRILSILNFVRRRSDQLKVPRFAELDENNDCFGLKAYSGLRMIVERTLHGANVEIKSHGKKLCLGILAV
jgi:hypothetical protein